MKKETKEALAEIFIFLVDLILGIYLIPTTIGFLVFIWIGPVEHPGGSIGAGLLTGMIAAALQDWIVNSLLQSR